MLVDFDKPTLQTVFDGFTGNETWGKTDNVFEVGDNGHAVSLLPILEEVVGTNVVQWQYWVIQQDNVTAPPVPHPIHLHGHDFFVLAQQANAVWNGDISTLNMNNPIRRDTATLPAQGYLVLAFESDNPGAWLVSSTLHRSTEICANVTF